VVQEAFADDVQDASFEGWKWSLKDSQELAKLARIQQKVKEKLKGKARAPSQPEQSSPAFNLRSRARAAPRKRGSGRIVLDKDSELVDGSSQDEAREDGRGRARGRSSVRFDKSPPRKRRSQQIASEESSESEHRRREKGRSSSGRRSAAEGSASAGRRQAKKSSGQDKILEAVKAMAQQARKSRSKRSKRRSSRRASKSSDGSSSSSSSESSESSTSEESESDSDSGGSESSVEAKKRCRKAKSRGRSKRSRGRSRQERRSSRSGDARARAGESVRYQLHALRNEVRGAKPENAASIHELFAAWAALANIQSEVDTAKSVYGPTRLPRVLEEAKQQCLDDFKLAAGMLHEGQGKAELLRTAEKMVINSLVQQSRKQVLVRKFELFKMVDKAVATMRDFVGKHVSKQGPSHDSRQGSEGQGSSKGGMYGGGRGKGGRGGGKGQDQKLCYVCGAFGHISHDCPSKPAFRFGNPAPQAQQQQYTAVPPPPQYQRQPAAQVSGERKAM
jgi:hypothetical protein